MKPQLEGSRQVTDRQYRQVMDRIPYGIVETGPNGNVLLCNKSFSRMYNRTDVEIVGKYFWDFVKSPDSRKLMRDHFNSVVSNSSQARPLFFKLEQNGSLRDVRVDWDSYSDEDGRVMSVVAVFTEITEQQRITGYGAVKTDVTRRRQLEEELKRSYEEVLSLKRQAESANRMKSYFLANMSHDIRTPLNGILGFADLLLKQDLNQKESDYVKKIISSGQTLMALLGDILDFSKIEAGQLDIQAKTFDLDEFLGDLESMFELQFKEKNIDFYIQVAPNCSRLIHHDKWRLQQVLMNLLSNALKFTEQGSVGLEIIEEAGGTLLFRVSDTGPGIPPEYIHEIFKPFSQVQSNTAHQKKGTGLGLAICKNLVALMGGDISVNSVPDEGSAFSVSIPVNNSIESGSSEKEVEDAPEIECENECFPSTILIAEDNPVNKELLEEQLRDYGFSSLLFAADGVEAVEIALKHRPALVLMDIQMPRMDGKEAIRQLRSKQFKTPILVMSAYAMQDDIDSALRAGADGYITKPVDFDRFFYEVRTLLTSSNHEPLIRDSNIIPPCCMEEDKGRWLRFSPGVSERLRSIFMKDTLEKLEVLIQVKSGDDLKKLWDEVKTIAHGYKGSAVHFGLSCLEKLSRQLDEGMRDGLPVKTLMGFLRQLVYLLEQILEENSPHDK